MSSLDNRHSSLGTIKDKNRLHQMLLERSDLPSFISMSQAKRLCCGGLREAFDASHISDYNHYSCEINKTMWRKQARAQHENGRERLKIVNADVSEYIMRHGFSFINIDHDKTITSDLTHKCMQNIARSFGLMPRRWVRVAFNGCAQRCSSKLDMSIKDAGIAFGAYVYSGRIELDATALIELADEENKFGMKGKNADRSHLDRLKYLLLKQSQYFSDYNRPITIKRIRFWAYQQTDTKDRIGRQNPTVMTGLMYDIHR